MKILNSSFGLLVAGAIISGLLVQSITSKWQQRNWLFQQAFTSERTKFEKELEQKYKVLEEINSAVTAILTHSQLVVVGYMKDVSQQQKSELIRNYNEAVTKWEMDFRTYVIRLKTFFVDKELPALWDSIKKERDTLDVAIYMISAQKQELTGDSLKLIEKILNMTGDLSLRMLTEVNQMKQRDFGAEAHNT